MKALRRTEQCINALLHWNTHKVNAKKKAEEKEGKKQESDKLKDELLSKGNSVLKIKIQKEKKRREKLLDLQESTRVRGEFVRPRSGHFYLLSSMSHCEKIENPLQ